MFLGIDIGSTYIKYALLDISKKGESAIYKTQSPRFLANTNPDIKEYSGETLYQAVKSVIDDTLTVQCDIEGILLSTQMHGLILVDKNGAEDTNYISWQDARVREMMNGSDITYLEEIAERLGSNDIKPNMSAAPLFWHMENHDIKKGTRFMMMGDYLAWSLTGNYAACHVTNAASSGMYDIKEKKWSKEVISRLGFEDIIFPDVTESIESVGEYKSVPIYCAVGDHQASALGCMPKINDMLINVGTGTQISMVSDKMRFGKFETRPFFNYKYLLTASDLPSGRDADAVMDKISKTFGSLFSGTMTREQMWSRLNSIIDGSPEELKANHQDIEESDAAKNMMLEFFADLADKIYIRSMDVAGGSDIGKITLSGGLVKSSRTLVKLISERFSCGCVYTGGGPEAISGLKYIAEHINKSEPI